MKLHKIRTRFKVTIVLCPSLLKISLWRSEKGHRATWRGKYQQRNQFAAIFNQSDPEWSRPRGRVSQDHSGSLILGVGIVCGTEFRPRVTQDHSGSPRSGGSDRSWNRAQRSSQYQPAHQSSGEWTQHQVPAHQTPTIPWAVPSAHHLPSQLKPVQGAQTSRQRTGTPGALWSWTLTASWVARNRMPLKHSWTTPSQTPS